MAASGFTWDSYIVRDGRGDAAPLLELARAHVQDEPSYPMRMSFVAPSTRHPSGGVAVIYEMATAMARRGHDVHLYHLNFFDGTVRHVLIGKSDRIAELSVSRFPH